MVAQECSTAPGQKLQWFTGWRGKGDRQRWHWNWLVMVNGMTWNDPGSIWGICWHSCLAAGYGIWMYKTGQFVQGWLSAVMRRIRANAKLGGRLVLQRLQLHPFLGGWSLTPMDFARGWLSTNMERSMSFGLKNSGSTKKKHRGHVEKRPVAGFEGGQVTDVFLTSQHTWLF